MASPAEANAALPIALIFLDIDGVLFGNRKAQPIGKQVEDQLQHLFATRTPPYTAMERRIAESRCFSQSAIANLETLIERISEVAKVGIVISSAWRKTISTKDFKEKIFELHAFSMRIIGKTANPDTGYAFDCRGHQINTWIEEVQFKYKRSITQFVIFDDNDDGISRFFPKNFIKVNPHTLLSQSDIENAYEIMTQAPVAQPSSQVCTVL